MTDQPDEPLPRLRPVLDLSLLVPLDGADDDDDEPMGGDPACWAHLFEDEDEDDPHTP
jgi:hypothetical protein